MIGKELIILAAVGIGSVNPGAWITVYSTKEKVEIHCDKFAPEDKHSINRYCLKIGEIKRQDLVPVKNSRTLEYRYKESNPNGF